MDEELKKIQEALSRITEAGKVLSAANRKLVEEIKTKAVVLSYHPKGKELVELCDQLLASSDVKESDQGSGQGEQHLLERQFTAEERKALADKGFAMPDGSYPIETKADLANAIKSYGRSPDEATKKHIMKRAKAMDMMDALPEDWKTGLKEAESLREARTVPAGSFEDIENRVRAALVKKYAKPGPNGNVDRYSVWPVATYPDHVVIRGEEDGKLWDIPYTVKDGEVELGDAIEVVTTFQRVSESVQIIEAVKGADGKAEGKEWDVILIEAGTSKNGKHYDREVLRKAAPLFEGVYAYADHATDAERAARPERSVKDKVGRYSNVQFGKFKLKAPDGTERVVEGLKARFKVIQPWLRETLKEAVEMGEPDFVGFSIDAEGKISKRQLGGRMVDWVEAIVKVHSVDVVTTPAAGGRVVRLVASDRKEVNMDPEEIKRMIAEAMAGVAAQQATQSATAIKEAVAEALKETAKPADDVASLKQEITLLKEAERLRDRAATVDTALGAAAGLSELGKKRIRESFAELSKRREWEQAELDAAIKEAIDYEAALVQASANPRAISRMKVGDNSQDKMVKALDGMFDAGDIDGVPRFKSLKEAYCRWTGSDPFEVGPYELSRAFTTRYDSAIDHGRLKESLTTADWASVFADAMYKKMMRAYATDAYAGWRRFVSEFEDVPDFMQRKWYRVGGYSDLSTVAEQATYQPLTSPGDEEVNYQVAKRGGLDDVTWEAIVNDQVSRLRQIPVAMGRAAARTLFKFVLNMITTDNPDMDYDTTDLYHADHGANTATDALSLTAVLAGIRVMRSQTAFGESSEILGERNKPKFLIVPNELEALGKRIANPSDAYTSSVADAGAGVTHDPQAVKSYNLEVVVYDVLTSATGWYLVADPAQMNTVVMGFLAGRQDPELFVQDQPTVGSVFTADKVTYKCRHVYGGDILDHRSFYRGNV